MSRCCQKKKNCGCKKSCNQCNHTHTHKEYVCEVEYLPIPDNCVLYPIGCVIGAETGEIECTNIQCTTTSLKAIPKRNVCSCVEVEETCGCDCGCGCS